MKKCPFCAGEIQDAAGVCRFCGRDTTEGVSQLQAVATRKRNTAVLWVVVGTVVLALLAGVVSWHGRAPTAAISSAQLSPETLRNVVISANEKCDRVTLTFNQGMNTQTGQASWNIACSDGHEFVISIEASGTTHVVSCAVMSMTGGECFKTFEEQKKK